MMYGKLILRNVKRSVKDYLIYIVTLTLCVTMFYSFLSISSNYYKPDIGSEYDLNMLSDGMKTAICGVTLLLLFLIKYVNNYMIQRRQKEFAIQTVMGMERKTTAVLFFVETMLMGLVALGLGIVIGTFCSQFITAILLSTYGKSFKLSWMLYPDTFLLTVVFFTLSYALIGLFNVHTIRKIKVIDMLNADKENESDFKKSKWMPMIIVLFAILSAFMLERGISYKSGYFDIRLEPVVKFMFWGNILLPGLSLVVIFVWVFLYKKLGFSKLLILLIITALGCVVSSASVPVLRIKYYLSLPKLADNTYMIFFLGCLIFIVCCIFYFVSSLITVLKKKSIHHKYKDENLFFFGQIISKLKTSTKTMTLVCLTLALSIGLFLIEPALSGWALGFLDSRSVFDIQMVSNYKNVYDTEDLPNTNYEPIMKYLLDNEVQISDECIFSTYFLKASDFNKRVKWEFPVVAIALSDYNHLLGMMDLEPIELNGNKFTTQWHPNATKEERSEFLVSHNTIETDMGPLILDSKKSYDFSLGELIYNFYTDVIYVLPDETCKHLMSAECIRFINTVEPIPYDIAIELQDKFQQIFPGKVEEGDVKYSIRTSTEQVNNTKASVFIMKASMIYGAVVLLIMCFTILALQQLSDASHYRYRFGVLRNLGVDESRIHYIVLKQLGVWFGLPISIAVIVATVFGVYFFNTISSQISAYIGVKTLALQILLIVVILLILLACYFITTRILFHRAIRKKR